MKTLLTGNEAIARGAYEYGVSVAAAYPGTPSTEILENIAKYPEIYCQWSPNEKVAMEVGVGAAIAGARTIVTMKHVGVNVAADPLFTAAYTGVRGGLVLVSADDPGMHSSQNEQDNRNYAPFAKIPMLEPSDSQEAKDMVKLALDMSERFDTPVLLRITTRIAHSQSLVELGEPIERTVQPYSKDAKKYVMIPAYARTRRLFIEERDKQLGEFTETVDVNRIEMADPSFGIITSGVAYQYVREAFPDASLLRLGMTHPLPKQKIAEFAAAVDVLFVVEELDPYLEDRIRALGIDVIGKAFLPAYGELSVSLVKTRLMAALGMTSEAAYDSANDVASDAAATSDCASADSCAACANVAAEACQTAQPIQSAQPDEQSNAVIATAEPFDAPVRPPVMCPGCPHRGVFYTLRQLRLVVSGDIGCYTLGTMAPLEAIDTCICMGASISGALGMEKANPDLARRLVSVIGDSTFLHSGVTGLMDIVYNGGTSTVIILDNSITAMTGHQHNPSTGKTLMGKDAPVVDFVALAKALGVRRVVEVDPLDLDRLKAVIKEEVAAPEPSVIITRRPCALIVKNTETPLECVGCKGCKACLRLGCPALSLDKGTRKVVVNSALCTGCGLCAQLCLFNALRKAGE
ncbi:indolepyruvate ferredoxin oxidoreductase subunit alpha [Heliobacterium gestii]|uniref:Indolepyruvate oxidoreductase subunit IorA n=1 Tax=Heliomicrobium gestii TaxID=2699 RepID=A0A845L5T2_HELGE|nr:thiamine pyrophosphate-dependent enzyme [Heliomicrobium gestii]MBM7865750.1 indolepyruvate ferredoxin oxidoreductase alpha subunit [Heliomicrobium gestii]MZP41997.1 indolepyruvate ferredoxin oxidoreductase subunit alpha [Heliomicrobium gestii]